MGSENRDTDGNGPVDVDDEAVSYDVSSDDRTWGVLVHASAFVGLVIPMGHIVAPLLIWLVKKEGSQFVDENGKEAVNFQISMTIYVILAGILVLLVIGILILPVLVLVWFALVVIASIRASNEQVYRYPVTIRLIS